MAKEVKVKLFELTRMLPQLPDDCHQKRWIERLQMHPSTVPGMELYVPADQVEKCKELISAQKLQRQSRASVEPKPGSLGSKKDSGKDAD